MISPETNPTAAKEQSHPASPARPADTDRSPLHSLAIPDSAESLGHDNHEAAGSGEAARDEGQQADASSGAPSARTHLWLRGWFVVFFALAVLWLNFGWVECLVAVGFTGLLNLGKGRHAFLRTFRDWTLVFGFGVLWTLSRSFADAVGFPLQEQLLIDVDRILGFGEQPVHRLQRWIDWDQPPQAWEGIFSFWYATHFAASVIPMAVLYVRNRDRSIAFLKRWGTMSMIGMAGYIFLPTVPPWLSSEWGNIDTVHRGVHRGYVALGSKSIEDAYAAAENMANAVAAMPSLHAAYAAMLFFFFAPGKQRIVQASIGFYALFMAFTIVITGKHWSVDVYAGWAVAYFSYWIWNRREAHLAKKEASHGASPVAWVGARE